MLLSGITIKWPLQYVYVYKVNSGLWGQYWFLLVLVEFISGMSQYFSWLVTPKSAQLTLAIKHIKIINVTRDDGCACTLILQKQKKKSHYKLAVN